MAEEIQAGDEVIGQIELVHVPGKAVDDKGQSLEVRMHNGEPAVVVDGSIIVRYSTLKRFLGNFKKRGEG